MPRAKRSNPAFWYRFRKIQGLLAWYGTKRDDFLLGHEDWGLVVPLDARRYIEREWEHSESLAHSPIFKIERFMADIVEFDTTRGSVTG